MSERRDRLAALARLSEAALLAQQARMARVKAEEAEIRRKLDALHTGRRARVEALGEGNDAAARAGADPLWHRWIEKRRTVLNHELARQRAAEEWTRADLARAFGRHRATEALADRATAAETLARRRRENG